MNRVECSKLKAPKIVATALLLFPLLVNGQNAPTSQHAPPGQSLAYPSKPIKIIIPLAVGGSSTVIARIIGDVSWLAYRWNKPLGVRVLPAPGKRAGDLTSFSSSALVKTTIQPLPGTKRQ